MDEAGDSGQRLAGAPRRPAVPPPVVPGAGEARTTGPPRPAAPLEPLPGFAPGQPLPAAQSGLLAGTAPPGGWGWRHALAGLALAYVPQILLYALSLLGAGEGADSGSPSLSSAVALIVGSVIVYGFQVFSAWLFSARFAGGMRMAWGFRKPTKAFFWSIPLGLFVVYAVSVVHDVIVHPEQQQIVSEFPRSASGAAAFIVLAVVMAPLFEEIFFRAFLFRGLAESWGWVWGAVASAAVFSLAHLQLSVFVPLFVLGFALAWVYHRTGSLWTSIAFHAVFNGIAVAAWILTG